jgi:hypothetical protein
MRSKILTHYIRVRVSDADHDFLKQYLKIKNISVSEMLREFISNLRHCNSGGGKHKETGK